MTNKLVANSSSILLFSMSVNLAGCHIKEPADNHLRYLTESDEQCISYDAARMDYIRKLPSGFLTGYQGNQMEIAVNRIAGIPDRDLDHLLWSFSNRKLTGIKPGFALFGVAGVTSLSSGRTKSGFRGMEAVSITTGANQAGFALQHEVGHAVEIVAREAAQKTEYSNFDAAMRDVVNELNSKGGLIRGYAKSSPGEAWAESYANYYCSPKTQSFIRDNLPRTFKFLSAVLTPARWATPAAPAPAPAPAPVAAPAPAPGPVIVSYPINGQGGQQGPQQPTLPTTSDGTASSQGTKEASGEWLDKLVKQANPSIFKPSTAAQSSFLSNADSSNDSIRIALEDPEVGSTDTGILFASDGDADQILVCFDTEAACKAKRALSEADSVLAVPRTKIIGGRSFFLTKYFRADQANYLLQPWTALAYDKDGALLSSRRFMLSGKAKNAKR